MHKIMKFNIFKIVWLTILCVLAMPQQSQAQSTDFCEYTREFFSSPKSYSIESYGIKMMGPSGITICKNGEASLSVTSNGFTYRYKDGSGSSYKITAPMKSVSVITSHGDVQMQMYILDDGTGVRAIKYKDGHCDVHQYVLNNPSGKYVHNNWFSLKK